MSVMQTNLNAAQKGFFNAQETFGKQCLIKRALGYPWTYCNSNSRKAERQFATLGIQPRAGFQQVGQLVFSCGIQFPPFNEII